jgi:hypothetical protein
MKKKKIYLIFAGILVLFILILIIFRGLSGEDSWIRDSKGVWVKHGNPSEIPNYVLEQQEAINCASNLYNQEKNKGTSFNSQCLGACGNYAVDVVHVPRTQEDNLIENQCEDYRNGIVSNFIELDRDGSVVNVVD